ncbi:plastocyanin/azurin family copper-binding protein [Paenibacillus alkalitolerans]|uniref:plastocyanin/azurin family copper-binding protein n=1 Tax=Paenibacillus alkalitolerans TaxID=2799335 RepID=UPI0018F2E6C7|nr:plastocyanin/azurin family copper-binding protein [Paenibacillus alkalitolerans]
MAKNSGAWTSLVVSIALVFLSFVSVASAEESQVTVQTDADIAKELGLLLGDGDGVTAQYLSKKSTRMQAAIISLRLKGLLQEAANYTGTANFSDAGKVGKENAAILAYLKAHPEEGWTGTGSGAFDPLAEISSQQLYKVLLETLGFRSGADFTYAETEQFAASKGLRQIAGTKSLTNAHIATALVESLSAATADSGTLFSALQSRGAISADAKLPLGDRISLRANKDLGTYFTDEEGRTLYFFTKDAEDPNSCKDNCLKNWPVYYTDHLQIPSSLNKADFGVLARTDGAKQLTYKGWPLYYFVKDAKAGDVNGEAVNGVWFVAKSDYKVMIGTSTTLGNYLTDDYGRTLYYFNKDTPKTSVCEGKCITNWPVYTSAGGSVPTTLKSADFGEITRSDGNGQSTFKDYPLYYFVQDKSRGETKGQDVNQVWFVIDPAKFNGTSASASSVKTYNVDIKEFSFGTEPLTVEAGSKIVFTNHDNMKHNAVAEDGSFSTPLLAKGESYTITLAKTGTYEYYCEPHKDFMTGTIIVK